MTSASNKEEILQNLCTELNENCKFKNESKDRDSWYPNQEWDISDLDLNIERCRKYCYTSHADVYNEYVALCQNCESVLHKHLDKFVCVFEKTHEDLCLEMYELKQEVERLKQDMAKKSN